MKTIIIDTETTGIEDPDVIEVGYIGVEIEGGQLKPSGQEFEQRYKPSKPIGLGAMAVHHILPHWLDNCEPSGSFTIPESVEFIIGHNIDFDWRALGEPDLHRICTLALARKYYPELDGHSQVALVYYFSKDKEAARERVMGAHSALPDVKMCGLVLASMLRDRLNFIESIEHLHQISEQARIPDVITFGKHKGTTFNEVPQDYLKWMVRQADMCEYVKTAARKALGV